LQIEKAIVFRRSEWNRLSVNQVRSIDKQAEDRTGHYQPLSGSFKEAGGITFVAALDR
jgi:hypothetical protein